MSVRHAPCAGRGSDSTSDARTRRPSVEPSHVSDARSGCGIIPTTLPRVVGDARRVVPRAVRVVHVRNAMRGSTPSSRRVVALVMVDRDAQALSLARTRASRSCRCPRPRASSTRRGSAGPRSCAAHPGRGAPRPGSGTRCRCRARERRRRPARATALHHRREARDRAGAQVVAVREPARAARRHRRRRGESSPCHA